MVIFEQRNSSLVCHELLQKRKLWDTTQMMKHFSITALTFSALLALNNPVNAEGFKVGDVFYCEVESGAFADTPNFEFTKWKPFNFKFKIVSRDLIKYGSGGYFNNSESKIGFMSTDMLETNQTFSMFSLNKERFNYGSAGIAGSSMLTGTCDKF